MAERGSAGAGNEPFDRSLRRQARARGRLEAAGFLLAFAHEELRGRRALLGPGPAGPVLVVGGGGAGGGDVAMDCARPRLGGFGLRVVGEEDRLPFADGVFAEIWSLMSLHGVNDLPGALLLARRALMPGGRYLAVFPAGVCLGAVRQAFLEADLAHGGAVAARVGPTVDPAQGAGLLHRAGFLEPVAEVVPVAARYRRLADLAHDLRAMGETGWLRARDRRPMTRARWQAAETAFARQAEADGKVRVEAELLFLSAKAP
ncbi:methyltransferase domain-containing protein [Thermaurantiacus sp.]